MHRIDGPGATVDNRFTDGDVVGGVQATQVTDEWLNDMQEELISALAAAGITPVKGTQDQLLKAIRSLAPAVAGTVRNGRLTIAVPSASATYFADEVIVETALGGQAFKLPGFNKTISLAALGAGGMDVGTAPVNGYVALYAIYNPTTKASALLAVNATAAAAPEVYGGTNMPAGYAGSCLLTVLAINASGQFKPAHVRGRSVFIPSVQAYTGSALSGTSISISAAVPLNAVAVSGNQSFTSTASGTLSMDLAMDGTGAGLCRNTAYVLANGGSTSAFKDIALATPQAILATASNSTGGTPTYSIIISGYAI